MKRMTVGNYETVSRKTVLRINFGLSTIHRILVTNFIPYK